VTMRRAREIYDAYVEHNRIRPHVRAVLERVAATLSHRPRFAVVILAAGARPGWIEQTAASLRSQIYPAAEIVELGTTGDARLDRAGLAAAIARLGADFLLLLPAGDRLAPEALLELARELELRPETDLLVADEDEIDDRGRRASPRFAPDPSPTLLLARDALGGLRCVRRTLLERLGELPDDPIAAGPIWAWDLALRVSELTDRIRHLPRVLHHRRSRARHGDPGDPPLEPVTRALARRGLDARPGLHRGAVELDFPDRGPRVTIIIPTLSERTLRPCLESLARTTYRDVDLLVIDNDATDPDTVRYLASLPARGVRVLRIANGPDGFSFSAINNAAVREVATDLLLFLNDDTEVREPRWLARMVGHLGLPGVGATGARLLHPDGRIQHAGVVLAGSRVGAPVHAFAGQPGDRPTYDLRAESSRECAAVTAACLLTRRATFLELGGFDAARFPVSLGDVDYCLRLAERGLRTVYVAGAELTHLESATRSPDDDPAELAAFHRRHGEARDGYHGPSLVPDGSFEVDPETVSSYHRLLGRPLHLALVVPSLAASGTARMLCDVALGLQAGGGVAPLVLAHADGPLRARLADGGVASEVVTADALSAALRTRPVDVVAVGGLASWRAIDVAVALDLPRLWLIPELGDHRALLDDLPAQERAGIDRGLAAAHRTIFPTEASRFLHLHDGHAAASRVIHAGTRHRAVEDEGGDGGTLRHRARRELGLAASDQVVLLVATSPAPARVATILVAAAHLARRDRVRCLLLADDEATAAALAAALERRGSHLGPRVRRLLDLARPTIGFAAADVAVLDPDGARFPYEVLDAMAAGLPIVTSLAVGLTELLRIGLNAVPVRAGDPAAIAVEVEALLDDDARRVRLGRHSRSLHDCMPSFAGMAARYERLVGSAWHCHER
jgi:GT2 family glycosyltransferase